MSIDQSEKFQDAITFTQPIIQEINDPETINLFDDQNHMMVLSILRTGPHTVPEIQGALREKSLDRSTKTIYRYLKKLEGKKLVVQGGKRVYLTPDRKHKTQTLFMRSAKIFFPIKGRTKKEITKDHSEMHEVLAHILEKRLDSPVSSLNCLIEVLSRFFEEETELTQRSILVAEEKSGKELSETIDKLEWKQIEGLVTLLGIASILLEGQKWENRIKKCFEKE
ncbi:MAG: hypothetical protein ACFFFG_00190 [Candidatus Thorarchaeota archaeon]